MEELFDEESFEESVESSELEFPEDSVILEESFEETEEDADMSEELEYGQVVEMSVDLMSADLSTQLERTNGLLVCIVFVMFIMYFRTIIYSIRRGV